MKSEFFKNQNLYDYGDLNIGINNIMQQIKDSNAEFNCVVGIDKNSMIPAVVVSNNLDIPCFLMEGNDDNLWMIDRICLFQNNILLVDTISRTGLKFNNILNGINMHNYFRSLVLINNINQEKFKSNFYGIQKDLKEEGDDWVKFWWEKN
jgi:hypoxanthine phosphoribosyltransferase